MFSGTLLTFCSCAQAPASPRRVALVIGNDAYGGEFRLSNSVGSANSIHYRLQALGFTVIWALDAKLSEMDVAFRDFVAALSAGCCAVLYFCGHGWQTTVNREHCCLLPVDFVTQGSHCDGTAHVC
jgi:uncharacterized caspase-like protein